MSRGKEWCSLLLLLLLLACTPVPVLPCIQSSYGIRVVLCDGGPCSAGFFVTNINDGDATTSTGPLLASGDVPTTTSIELAVINPGVLPGSTSVHVAFQIMDEISQCAVLVEGLDMLGMAFVSVIVRASPGLQKTWQLRRCGVVHDAANLQHRTLNAPRAAM